MADFAGRGTIGRTCGVGSGVFMGKGKRSGHGLVEDGEGFAFQCTVVTSGLMRGASRRQHGRQHGHADNAAFHDVAPPSLGARRAPATANPLLAGAAAVVPCGASGRPVSRPRYVRAEAHRRLAGVACRAWRVTPDAEAKGRSYPGPAAAPRARHCPKAWAVGATAVAAGREPGPAACPAAAHSW